jgi:hypothetical protein
MTNLPTMRFETVNSVDMNVEPYDHNWSPKGPCVKCGVREATIEHREGDWWRSCRSSCSTRGGVMRRDGEA